MTSKEENWQHFSNSKKINFVYRLTPTIILLVTSFEHIFYLYILVRNPEVRNSDSLLHPVFKVAHLPYLQLNIKKLL